MRIPSAKVDQKIFFVAYDSADHVTRKTGLSSFTVYRSRNGGSATIYTTPTIAELSSSNMPGLYCLTIDEDTTISSTSDSEEMALHITATGMDPVTRTIELYRQSTSVLIGTTMTVLQMYKLIAAALLGKASGMGTTTGILRDVDDTKDRITATIDSSGNRTAVTLDAT